MTVLLLTVINGNITVFHLKCQKKIFIFYPINTPSPFLILIHTILSILSQFFINSLNFNSLNYLNYLSIFFQFSQFIYFFQISHNLYFFPNSIISTMASGSSSQKSVSRDKSVMHDQRNYLNIDAYNEFIQCQSYVDNTQNNPLFIISEPTFTNPLKSQSQNQPSHFEIPENEGDDQETIDT